MKLKNILVIVFLALTLIPIAIVSILLYKSGFDLSKESYTRNLIESINVQVDYISQTIENNMILDYRFADKNHAQFTNIDGSTDKQSLITAFQSYLEVSEDKITACMLLDKDGIPVYTIGEKVILDTVSSQLPQLSEVQSQKKVEFELDEGVYSLGVITPIRDENNSYVGNLISIYDKSYIFKIISSYYKVSDASVYLCRENGEIVNFKEPENGKKDGTIGKLLDEMTFSTEGIIDTKIGNDPISGYYKNIHNSPWYLVGFVDDQLIYAFTNKFVLVYIFIIIGVLIADVILSLYFSQKVVQPINDLIKVIEGYHNSFTSDELACPGKKGYFETQYLKTKFLELMKKILLVQHNFEGVYQLYQSNDMDDTNIDIDVKNQTISSNKEVFSKLINEVNIPEDTCIVEKFVGCFCEKDQAILMDMFENMRDEHLAVTREAEIYTPHLNQKWFHTLVVPMYTNERLSRLFIQLRDISSFRKQEYESNEQAKRDSLTGLYNRAGFTACVNEALHSGGTFVFHGLLFIDMDYFKLVNDNFGHSAGDDLLRSVGQVLLEETGEKHIASRFGGDEFAVFLINTNQQKILEMKEKLEKRLVYPFQKENISFVVSVSIGVSMWSNTAPDTLERLLEQADAAMYKAKRAMKENKKSAN